MIIVKTRWHVPQMRPDLSGYPAVWIWWLGVWRRCEPQYPQYPNDLYGPASFWCYEDPTGEYDVQEADYSSLWNYLDTETRHTTVKRPPQ